MELHHQCKSCMILVLSFFLFTQAFSASTFISDAIFEPQRYTGRALLQAKTPCPVNFEFQNYTIITSQCKGPKYLVKLCCAALKEFACPFADELNDLSNDCASTMFSYINLYGKYPPGLFANECKEGKQGLECPAQSPSSTSAKYNSSQIRKPSPLLMMLTAALLVFVSSFLHMLS